MTKAEINTRALNAINSVLENGISKTEFAESVNISPQSLNEYLRGRTFVTTEVMASICGKYGISPTWLLLAEGPMYGRTLPKVERDKKVDELNNKIVYLTAENSLLREQIKWLQEWLEGKRKEEDQ